MAYVQDDCGSETSGVCPVTVAKVESKSTKGKCQNLNQAAYALDDCGFETSGTCPVKVNQRGVSEQKLNGIRSRWLWLRDFWYLSSQSQLKESVGATIKRHKLWMIMAPRSVVSVQSKSTKGECLSNNQTAYALDDCVYETFGVCPVTVPIVNISLVGTTTSLVIYLYLQRQPISYNRSALPATRHQLPWPLKSYLHLFTK